MNVATLQEARAAKRKAFEVCNALARVVGVGIAPLEDGYALKVNLEEPLPVGVSLPGSIDGVPLRVEVVGKIIKQ